MSRVIVFELKRLVPLLLLLILLAGLSFYDHMGPHVKKTGVIEDKNGFEQLILTDPGQGELQYTTKKRGYRAESSAFQIIETVEQWQNISQRNDLVVNSEHFDQDQEIGIFAFHSEIVEIRHGLDEPKSEKEIAQVEIKVIPKQDFYHVIVIDKNEIQEFDISTVEWQFIDEHGEILSKFRRDI